MNDVNKKLCVLDYAFQRIGGKYKGRILLALNSNDRLRYGELSRLVDDISTKMLTQALKELESDELIVREMFSEIPPRVEYSLTDTGKQFIPILIQLANWGAQQISKADETNK